MVNKHEGVVFSHFPRYLNFVLPSLLPLSPAPLLHPSLSLAKHTKKSCKLVKTSTEVGL